MSRDLPVKTRKYNPGFLSDAELIAGFCVRLPELAQILETLRENVYASNQHILTIGSRGSGKTTLLLRAIAECHQDSELQKRWLPVLFMEESYEVQSIGEFWLECLYHLARGLEGTPAAEQLMRTHKQLMAMLEDDKSLAERARAQVLDVADRQGKRLLLVVENLNMLFEQMDNADNVGWKLRHTLQNEPRIMLLASATSRFEQIDHQDKALFDLFRTIHLSRLTTEECAELWKRVSGHQTEKSTIRAMEILTGGNPRLLAIVSIFGANKSFAILMDELLDLVDDHTDYFKSHLENLPPRERRVYLALADLWKPATAKEISQRARQDVRNCSALLNRLVQRGVATEDPNSKPRKKLYYLTERLFNIYYLLRRQRQPDAVVTALVHFMTAFYPQRELLEIGTNMLHDAQTGSDQMKPLIRCAFSGLLQHWDSAVQNGEGNQEGSVGGYSEDVDAEFADQLVKGYAELAKASLTQEERELSLNEYERLIKTLEAGGDKIRLYALARAMFNQSWNHGEMGHHEEALQIYGQVIDRFGESKEPKLQEIVARAMFNQSWNHSEMGHYEEALQICGQVIDRFGGSKEPNLQELVATAMLNQSIAYLNMEDPEKALYIIDTMLRQRIEKSTGKTDEILTRGMLFRVVLLEKLHRNAEALVTIQNLLAYTQTLDNNLLGWLIDSLIKQTVHHGPSELLKTIVGSPMARLLQPLIVALQEEVGENVSVAVEVREVAADIRKKIHALQAEKNN